MEHVVKQKGRWRFTLKPIAERADFSNKTVGLNQNMFIRIIYIYDIFGSESISSIPDNWTFWQRDNVWRNHGYPSWPRSRPHRPVQQRWSTNERNKRDALQQAINIMGHRFPQLSTFTAERFYGVFHMIIYDPHEIISIFSPYFHIFPIQKSLRFLYAFLRHRSTSAFSSFVSHVRQRDGLADGPG